MKLQHYKVMKGGTRSFGRLNKRRDVELCRSKSFVEFIAFFLAVRGTFVRLAGVIVVST